MEWPDTVPETVRDKRKAKKDKAQSWAEWVQTHTILFTASEQANILSDLEEEDVDVLKFCTALSDVGIKSSFKYHRRQNQYELRIFRDDPGAADAGYALQVRANNFERCVAGMLFAIKDVQDFNIREVTELRERFESDF